MQSNISDSYRLYYICSDTEETCFEVNTLELLKNPEYMYRFNGKLTRNTLKYVHYHSNIHVEENLVRSINKHVVDDKTR